MPIRITVIDLTGQKIAFYTPRKILFRNLLYINVFVRVC